MNVTIKAAGTWLHSLGPIGDLTFSTSMRGCLAASWKMLLPIGFTHRALRQGARVELYVGTLPIWSGTLSEPDRVTWEFTADGLHRLGETTDAMAEPVSGSFVPTTVIDDAIDAAIARGLPWRRAGSISSVPLSTDSSDAANINTLTALLDKWCEVNGKEWMVKADGEVIAYDPPLTPRWALKPGVPALAVADDDYYSRVFVRYVSEVSGSPAEPSAWSIATAVDEDAAARWGAREESFDMSDLGYLTTTQAQAVANALLTNGKTRPAFTQGVEVSIAQLTTLGGTSPAPWQVQAGQQGLTQYGVLTTDGGITAAGSLFWVIGGTEWTAGSRAITLTPRGLLPVAEAQVIGAIAAATTKEFR